MEARKKGVCFSPQLCFASVCDLQSEGIVYSWIGFMFMTRSENGWGGGAAGNVASCALNHP